MIEDSTELQDFPVPRRDVYEHQAGKSLLCAKPNDTQKMHTSDEGEARNLETSINNFKLAA